MIIAPQHIEALFTAARQNDRAQFRAWLEIFSGPEERYAAVRALAEGLGRETGGPAYDLACWAKQQLDRWLGFATDMPVVDRPIGNALAVEPGERTATK
ncbi:MAG TPA: hypothetical protein VFX76_04295 [Roseiflexaceae bacterium]|nr:hypothetical protein [Roseiflexaceae bacterium]